jgi:hypothetical protein
MRTFIILEETSDHESILYRLILFVSRTAGVPALQKVSGFTSLLVLVI